jgi:glycoside/pentoside/hexuronide:cation symporter, GPH family
MSAGGAGLTTLSPHDGLRYGLLGFPLAFCALPLYVLLPNLYAREFGVALATLGAILLGARLLDALIDPFLGRWCDRLFARSLNAVQLFGAMAACVLALGFALLFIPPTREPQALLWWATGLLVLTYTAYSALAVAHQSWGAMLGGDESLRSRVVAWREGLGLTGVVLAATLPSLAGVSTLVAVFAASLVLGLVAWRKAPRPVRVANTDGSLDLPPGSNTNVWRPWRISAFRRLMVVFLLNGIASAVPATLVLFFVQDRLQAPLALQPLFLGSYFVFGALSMPVWLLVVKRFGLARSWLMGMVLAFLVFLWAMQLGAGDTAVFVVICALSGVALGSDLALPGAMLAGVIGKAGDAGRAEGAYFGWWNFATKLNLALAAGIALPMLQWLGYTPGNREPEALQTLTLAYCLLPCLLKAAAAVALYCLIIQPATSLEPP